MSANAPRQIRFVNNEGHPPPKRRRIAAACRTCRKRKTRCDGKKPMCQTCADNGHVCLGFAEEPEIKRPFDGNRHGESYTEAFEERRMDVHWDTAEQYERDQQSEEPSQMRFDGSPKDSSRSSDDHQHRRSSTGHYRNSPVYSDDAGKSPPPHLENQRVPYFRYFGPTAIVPGFKQMVVSVRERRRSNGAACMTPISPGSSLGPLNYGRTPPHPASESRRSAAIEMPTYDPNDERPVHRLIIHLVETFFTHLGCNYPFLRQKGFTQRVEERSVEPILVDAVCALAARFSDHRLLTAGSARKSEYGHAFAQRARAAVVDTFPCPTLHAVQSCLLLAYESFGSNQDSALWMYLGCAIRMAEDLGLQKLDGVKHQGNRDFGYHRSSIDSNSGSPVTISAEERLEIEQEHIDLVQSTVWTVFILDRLISSGTGRPVTLRDRDLELAFPAVTSTSKGGWPDPFPALIQIIHLYGRVSDLLNNIKNVRDVTPKRLEGLSSMGSDLTDLYQKLDDRLTFNAANFQHYVKSGEGTNFILVHFWFHTLIVLLHQPTLMHTFESQILQLLPNSRELSMSSAKTIADILAFAELIDPRSFIGNPFTSQPMYIAACAFLMESAAQTISQPASRSTTPPHKSEGLETSSIYYKASKQKEKHSLLAAAANQNYQRCYKALQQVEIYWAGARYILVALDQKAKGIWDPETYTEQEYESTKVRQEILPTWRRKLALAGPNSPRDRLAELAQPLHVEAGSPASDPAQAIAWSLTGTTDSLNSNLTFMYTNSEQSQPPPQRFPSGPSNMKYDPIRQTLPEASSGILSPSEYRPRSHSFHQERRTSQPMAPPAPKYSPTISEPATTSEAEMLLGLQHSPYSHSHSHSHTPVSQHAYEASLNSSSPPASRQERPFDFPQNSSVFVGSPSSYVGLGAVGDVVMESQDIHMSSLGGDVMPWLGDYLPQELLQFFDTNSAPP